MRSPTRPRRAFSSNGTLDRRLRLIRTALLGLGLGALVLWLLWSFAQEMQLNRELAHRAAELRRQNAALESENAGYRRDIAASSSGAAAEEEARQNGYSRPTERVYLVVATPSPTPSAAPARTPRP